MKLIPRIFLFSLGIFLIPFFSYAGTATTSMPDGNFIQMNVPDDNNGTNTKCAIANSVGSTHVYRCSFRGTIPATSTVTVSDASLFLYYYGYNGDPVGKYVSVCEMPGSWDEDTQTWNNNVENIDWTTCSASTTMPGSFGWLEMDVTNVVDDYFASGSTTVSFYFLYSMASHGSYPTYFEIDIYSDDYATDSLRPYLSYTTSTTPEPTPTSTQIFYDQSGTTAMGLIMIGLTGIIGIILFKEND